MFEFFNEGRFDEVRVQFTEHGIQLKTKKADYVTFTWLQLQTLIDRKPPADDA